MVAIILPFGAVESSYARFLKFADYTAIHDLDLPLRYVSGRQAGSKVTAHSVLST
jgi:hypothetical protein